MENEAAVPSQEQEQPKEMTQNDAAQAFANGVMALVDQFGSLLNLGSIVGALQVVQLDLHQRVSRMVQEQVAAEQAKANEAELIARKEAAHRAFVEAKEAVDGLEIEDAIEA